MGWQKGKVRSNGKGSRHSKRAPGAMQELKLKAERRDRLPLPDSALMERSFVYDSVSKVLVAPWGRNHCSTFATEAMLLAMTRVIAAEGAPHGVYWLHPSRPPVRVEAEDVHVWLACWQRDHAAYRVDAEQQAA
jgi:hypothetical protein